MCLTRVACQVRDCLFKQPSKPSVHDRNRQLCVDIFNASRLRRGLPTMPVTEPAPAPPRSAAAVGGAPPGNDDDDDVDDATREIEKEMRDSLTIEAALVALIEHGNAERFGAAIENAAGGGHVLKCSVAAIVKQPAGLAAIGLGRAVGLMFSV